MKQEPVAWTDGSGFLYMNDENLMLDDETKSKMIPLYTAPRELSMEEIEDCMPDGATPDFVPHNKWFKEFANNILKKASEK